MAPTDGVTLNADLDLTSGSPYVAVTNGLTLGGTMTLGYSGRVYINGTQTWTGVPANRSLYFSSMPK